MKRLGLETLVAFASIVGVGIVTVLSFRRLAPRLRPEEGVPLALGVTVIGAALAAWALGRGIPSLAGSRWAAPSLVVLVGGLSALAWFSHVPPISRSNQMRTKAALVDWGDALERFRKEHGRFPSATDVKTMKDLPAKDGWGYPIEISISSSGYEIRSLGLFHERDAPSPVGPTSSYESDMIFANGRFIAVPEGIQK